VPGAGKSALIQALGCRLTAEGHRVAEDAERDVRIGALSPVLGAQAIVRALRVSGMSSPGRAEEQASCAEAAIDCGGIPLKSSLRGIVGLLCGFSYGVITAHLW
jgi:hypothetical protein